jgi:hypothetical protein
MAELMNFIGNLNLGTFIALWTSTICLVLFVFFLSFSVNHVNKEIIEIRKKVSVLVEELSKKQLKLGDDDI